MATLTYRINTIILIGFFLICKISFSYSQNGSISGFVSDASSGEPIANLTVFIPFTTKGTTTNANGAYLLDHLSDGDYSIVFKHLAFISEERSINISEGGAVELNLMVSPNTVSIDEVVKSGRIPDGKKELDLFFRFCLGDPTQRQCKLLNPQVLSFYYDGDLLFAHAREPLELLNNHLGYRITYYLDYFKYREEPDAKLGDRTYYAFAGDAFFKDLSNGFQASTIKWKHNRQVEFIGNLHHFFRSLYQNNLLEEGYIVRQIYYSSSDLQAREKLSDALSKIRMAQMDSIQFWNPETTQKESLYYFPKEEYLLPVKSNSKDPESRPKILSLNNTILVFKDFRNTKSLDDDVNTLLVSSSNQVKLYSDGNYKLANGSLKWTNLDSSLGLISILPDDYY